MEKRTPRPRDRDPHLKNKQTPKLSEGVIKQAKLGGALEELTAKVSRPQPENWWRGYSQHVIGHVTAVAVTAGLLVAYDALVRSNPKPKVTIVTSECAPIQRPVLRKAEY